MVLSRSSCLSSDRSESVTIFLEPVRSRFDATVCWASSTRLGDSGIAASLFAPDHLERSRHVDEVLEPERLALSFFALHQIHRHFDEAVRAIQALHQHL